MNFLFPRTLTRKQYALRFVTYLILFVAAFFLSSLIEFAMVLVPSMHHKGLGKPEAILFFVLAFSPLLLVPFRIPCLDIPRLRSMGWSPWLVLLFLVPLVNLGLQVCLFAVPASVDYTDERDEGRTPEVRVLAWSAIIMVVLAVAYGSSFVYLAQQNRSTHRGLSTHGSAAPAPSDAPQTATASGPLKLVDSNLHVDSIFYQKSSHSSAVVNGNSVMVDDHVGNWVVSAISSNSVTFRNANGETSIVQVK